MFNLNFWLFQLCHVSLLLCLSNISLGWYFWKSLAKSGEFREKIRGNGHIGGAYRRGDSNLLVTMVHGLVFPVCASIFRWTHLNLPITFGYKLFLFSHYIFQIGIYIPNVPQWCFAASIVFQGLWFACAKRHGGRTVTR